MKKKVLVLLADGFEEMEAVICIDILRRGGLETKIACLKKNLVVCGSRNIKIQADMKLSEIKQLPDAIVLPGGMPGAENLANSKEANKLIKNCNNEKKIIAAICASPAIVLIPLGILDGKRATCYPQFEEKFGAKTAFVNEAVVVDGNIVTSQGPGTVFYFALKIVELLQGKDTAETVRKRALVK